MSIQDHSGPCDYFRDLRTHKLPLHGRQAKKQAVPTRRSTEWPYSSVGTFGEGQLRRLTVERASLCPAVHIVCMVDLWWISVCTVDLHG